MYPNTVKILDEKWDYLIVLDACRYDSFEKYYKEYLPKGNLSKKYSLGSNTPQWLRENFKVQTDIIYITGNPKICSTNKVDGFDAKTKFSKVYDIWHGSWNDKLNTVEPQVLGNKAKDIINENSGKRTIVHYMQPHEPYLTYSNKHYSERKKPKCMQYFIFRCIAKFFTCVRFYHWSFRWKISEMLDIEPSTQMYWLLKERGDEGLKEYYEENLRQALVSINDLIKYLSGTIVISSDHGEVLGENGLYGHWPHSKNQILREVPWFVIKNNKGKDIKSNEKTIKPTVTEKEVSKEEIETKLKMLGY
jgi:hypothetical protein